MVPVDTTVQPLAVSVPVCVSVCACFGEIAYSRRETGIDRAIRVTDQHLDNHTATKQSDWCSADRPNVT